MADHLGSDDIRALLFASKDEDEDSIIFGGDDSDKDPDFVLEESEPSDIEGVDENPDSEPEPAPD